MFTLHAHAPDSDAAGVDGTQERERDYGPGWRADNPPHVESHTPVSELRKYVPKHILAAIDV